MRNGLENDEKERIKATHSTQIETKFYFYAQKFCFSLIIIFLKHVFSGRLCARNTRCSHPRGSIITVVKHYRYHMLFHIESAFFLSFFFFVCLIRIVPCRAANFVVCQLLSVEVFTKKKVLVIYVFFFFFVSKYVHNNLLQSLLFNVIAFASFMI